MLLPSQESVLRLLHANVAPPKGCVKSEALPVLQQQPVLMLVASLVHNHRSVGLLLIRLLLVALLIPLMTLLVTRMHLIVQEHTCIKTMIILCLRRITMWNGATNSTSILNVSALAVFFFKGINSSQHTIDVSAQQRAYSFLCRACSQHPTRQLHQ